MIWRIAWLMMPRRDPKQLYSTLLEAKNKHDSYLWEIQSRKKAHIYDKERKRDRDDPPRDGRCTPMDPSKLQANRSPYIQTSTTSEISPLALKQCRQTGHNIGISSHIISILLSDTCTQIEIRWF